MYSFSAFFATSKILEEDKPNCTNNSSAGPECPKQSLTPILITLVGRFADKTEHTASPNPPIVLCSSTVIIRPVSLAAFIIKGSSKGFNSVYIYHSCRNAFF